MVQKFLASDEFSRVQGELLSLAASDGFERGLSMHQTEDEFADVLKKMVNFMPGVDCDTCFPILGAVCNVVPASSVVASERNEENGVSRILDDVAEVVAVESECVSSGPTDVMVALSVDGKGDVLIPSSVAGEENVINSFGV
ncbi:hypothetical protein Tco_1259003 [Tanacetum coccineum]